MLNDTLYISIMLVTRILVPILITFGMGSLLEHMFRRDEIALT